MQSAALAPRDLPAESPASLRRGPLRAIILAATGEDVLLCGNCASCEQLTAPGMDLSLAEILRAAARDDPQVLTCASLEACEDLMLRPIPCRAGLALTPILLTLQREAELRGLSSSSKAPSP